MIRRLPIYVTMCAALLWACGDEEYTLSASYLLTFSTDRIEMDTVFSNIPTATKDFWVYNTGDKGVRFSTVRLERGNQSGFRVNVDGVYLGQSTGYQTTQVEVRSGDSIRVFVELTAATTGESEPQLVEDNIVFTHESGAQQTVSLSAYAWDATMLSDYHVEGDETFTADKPTVIYGGLTVDSLATLTLEAGTTLYLRDGAYIDVYGTLLAQGTADSEVTLRGYRLDNMFDYLPYDRVSGQWGGIRMHASSFGNAMDYTDLHGAFTGLEIDPCDAGSKKLTMNACTVHNCQGYGIVSHNAWLELNNCQLSNTLDDCLWADGGAVTLNNCTLAQFYPFDAERGVALRFTAGSHDMDLSCYNTLVTGYADDEVMGEQTDDSRTFSYEFRNCILRTPEVDEDLMAQFSSVVFENAEDTDSITGKKHFSRIDTDNLVYDFRLSSESPAIDAADPSTAMPTDRDGNARDDKPDIGAYEAM